MKIFTLGAVLSFSLTLNAQNTCLPQGVTFSNQSEIDAFASSYPDCDEIIGNVTIQGDNIVDLGGLNQIIRIGGDFVVSPEIPFDEGILLQSFTGLENLESIGGDFITRACFSLTSFNGLSTLDSIGGKFEINGDSILRNFSGLESLKHIGGDFELTGLIAELVPLANTALESFEGLEGIKYIGGRLRIGNHTSIGCPALDAFDGLNNLERIVGGLEVYTCPSLVSFEGFDQLIELGSLQVSNNESLVSIFDQNLLQSIAGGIWISGNTILEHISGFGNTITIGESLTIYNNVSLTSLTGFQSLTTIEGSISISSNESLLSMEGLTSLESISGSLNILANQVLMGLGGFENLKVIGGRLSIESNPEIQDFQGLESLESIGDYLSVLDNGALNSLLDLSGVTQLLGSDIFIEDNPMLSDCHVQFICDYLNGGNPRVINNNANGCDSPAEVLYECTMVPTTVIESLSSSLDIYPNPSPDYLKIEFKGSQLLLPLSITIHDMMGCVIFKRSVASNHVLIPIYHYTSGLYHLTVQSDSDMHTERVVFH